jgi:hypothetical protein
MADQDREDDEKQRHDEQAEEDAALGGGHEDDAAKHEPESTESKALEADDADAPRKRPGGRPARSRAAQRRQPPEGSVAKSLMLFVLIVGGLIIAFVFLGQGGDNGNPAAPPSPKWAAGQTVDLELTLVASDAKDLACSSPKTISGKQCAFESPSKATTPAVTDDKKLFKPYTTTDRVQIIGAGLWSEPSMAPAKLPNSRFSVKCKFTIDGKLENPGVRWNTEGPWYPQQSEWYAGSFNNCTVVPP